MFSKTHGGRAMGYSLLQERQGLRTIRHVIESYCASGARRSEQSGQVTREYFPEQYWPGESELKHIEFALKHEGLNLPLLRELLPRLEAASVRDFILEKPTGLYRRRLWFLYEQFSGIQLEIANATSGNYVPLLDEDQYYAGIPVRSARHRVINNLPGTVAFSPMVRRTNVLKKFEGERLEDQCRRLINEIPVEVYQRALDYLYTKETKSSYAIERETPDQKRATKFVEALRAAPTTDALQPDALVTLQKTIVDPRFANDWWRTDQNYVGRSLASGDEEVHFIPPKPRDLDALMRDYIEASQRILASQIHPVVAAAMVAYPFVYVHPFDDGNGRLHRFLIHYVLAKRGFAPKGVIFPVSAVMLHRMAEYDRTLESFSKPVLPLIDYEMDARARLTVTNATADLYRNIDCTFAAETLFAFVKETIKRELPAEVRYLQQYDKARSVMKEVVDLPNRHADLFIRFCRQNNGQLGKERRRSAEFEKLTDQEVAGLERIVREVFGILA